MAGKEKEKKLIIVRERETRVAYNWGEREGEYGEGKPIAEEETDKAREIRGLNNGGREKDLLQKEGQKEDGSLLEEGLFDREMS